MGNQHGKSNELTESNIEMLEKRTNFPRERILKWYADFKHDCKNGTLDKQNFVKFYKELVPHHPDTDTDQFCEYAFKAFDSDNSGSIDFSEFLLSISMYANGDMRDKLNWAFDMYDMDDNDYIDVKEMNKVLESIYKLMRVKETAETVHNRTLSIFSQLDENKDKKISRAEFINGCLNDDFLRCLLVPHV